MQCLFLIMFFITSCLSIDLVDQFFRYCSDNDSNAVAMLLAKDGNLLNRRMKDTGYTPLMLASLSGSTNVVKLLLERGADSAIAENEGYTPMHGAAYQGRADVIRVLAEFGIDPNQVHPDGFAPLHRAAWGNEDRHTEAVRALLELGADPLPQNPQMKSARSMTKNRRTAKLLKMWERKKKSIRADSLEL